jgi:hypothetical protein
MSNQIKRVEALTVADLERFPVWRYTNDDAKLGGMGVRPVRKTPVKSLDGCIIGTQVRLTHGVVVWATLCNIDAANPHSTKHFLTLSVCRSGRWFHLARYFDFDFAERGPQALADFLELRVDQVFPISYDISRYCIGESGALIGAIEEEPRERLTDAQIIALAVRRRG